MSTGRIEKKIVVTMNPDELRSLADKMEEKFPKKRLGESAFIDFLTYGNDCTIELHAEQEWFHKKAGG